MVNMHAKYHWNALEFNWFDFLCKINWIYEKNSEPNELKLHSKLSSHYSHERKMRRADEREEVQK